jgi:hypothetical protein
MLSLPRRKLLAKSEVFKQQRATSPEEARNCTYEEQNGVDHPSGYRISPVDGNPLYC